MQGLVKMDRSGNWAEDRRHPLYYIVQVAKVALPLYPQFGTEPNGYYIPPRWVPLHYLRQMAGPGVDDAVTSIKTPNLCGDYAAAGLRLRPGAAERADHLSPELAHVLARRQAHAIESGNARLAEASRELLEKLLGAHLAAKGGAILKRLGREPGFLGVAGRFGCDFLDREARRHDVPCEPEACVLREASQGRDEEMTRGSTSGTAGSASPEFDV